MSTVKSLFEPCTIGAIRLAHRVALAPLTRMRSDDDLAPRPMNIDYYAQRATQGGLLISEATHISGESLAYPHTPGIWTEKQVQQWQLVTSAVHNKGGVLFCQLWHTGRVASSEFAKHPLVQEGGLLPPVSASNVKIPGRNEDPRPLSLTDIARVKENYIHAAKMALKAGFDGVEVHAAHGYLIDQFLNDGVNKRTDEYGGGIEQRCRLLFEVVDAVIGVWGSDRVAVRLSPHSAGTLTYYDATDSNPDALYSFAISGLSKRLLAYLLLTEPRWSGASKKSSEIETDPMFSLPLVNPAKFRSLFKGTLIGAGGFTPLSAKKAIANGDYDMIAFGRWFISNPDLPHRLRHGLPLNRYVRETFYGYEEEGYTDYPTFEETSNNKKYGLVDQAAVGTSLSDAKL